MNEEVPKGKKVFYKTWYGIILIVLCLIVIINSLGSSGSLSQSSEPTARTGDAVILSSQVGDCSSDVLLGRNKQIQDKLIRLSIAKDSLGVMKMVLDGQAFYVSGCTHSLVIDTDFSNAIDEVRIMDGKMVGESGWVPFEWAKKL